MEATIQDTFESLLNMHAPRKINKVRNEFTPWLTSTVRDFIAASTLRKLAQTRPKFSTTWAWARPRLTWPRFRVGLGLGSAPICIVRIETWAEPCFD